MRVCLLYDSLQPYRIGGAERWYYSMAERLAAAGHQVTYVTMRQWERSERGLHPTADVVAVGPWLANYGRNGNRTMAPPILFGLGVLWHLLRHGRRYDVVHTASFPFFSLLAAALARPFGGYKIVVDWLEFWSRSYWRHYLGRLGGIGWIVQRLCLAAPQHAFCLARLTEARLRSQGVNGPVEVLKGVYPGALTARPGEVARPLVVFAGRLIPEKRLPLALEAIALARGRIPALQAVVFGDGPDWDAAGRRILDLGLGDCVRMAGFAPRADLEAAMARATCLLHPSEREGYGLVVVEASSFGTPTVLVAGEDNAATELVEDGVNGAVVSGPSAAEIAAAIVRIHDAGEDLRGSTVAWFERNAARLSIGNSLDRVIASYAPAPAEQPRPARNPRPGYAGLHRHLSDAALVDWSSPSLAHEGPQRPNAPAAEPEPVASRSPATAAG